MKGTCGRMVPERYQGHMTPGVTCELPGKVSTSEESAALKGFMDAAEETCNEVCI